MLLFWGTLNYDVNLSVPRLPTSGGGVFATEMPANPGGSAANSAAWAAWALREARARHTVRLATRVGDDAEGRTLKAAVSHTPGLTPLWLPANGPTNRCLVLYEPSGERTLIGYRWPGVDKPSAAADLADPAVARTLARADIAWIDVSPKRHVPIWERTRGKRGLPLRHAAAAVKARTRWEIIIGSADEAERPSARTRRALGCELCIVTAGAEGGHYALADGRWRAYRPASLAAPLADTCGAGDSFVGGVLAALATGAPAAQAISTGTVVAARCVTHTGSWPV